MRTVKKLLERLSVLYTILSYDSSINGNQVRNTLVYMSIFHIVLFWIAITICVDMDDF